MKVQSQGHTKVKVMNVKKGILGKDDFKTVNAKGEEKQIYLGK